MSQENMDKKNRVEKVIEVLNKARSMELYSIHQYMDQHYCLDDKDYGDFAGKIKLVSIDEMRHAEWLAERIMELGGEPTHELSAKVSKGQDVHEIFSFNERIEDDTMDQYNQFMQVCRANGDNISAKLFADMLVEEQIHTNYFQGVADHIQSLGDSYLSKIAGSKAVEVSSHGFVEAEE